MTDRRETERKAVTIRRVIELHGDRSAERDDALIVEEPLEIRVAGETVAVTMRTPGSDGDLVIGFLFAEGLIRSIDDVGTIAPCGRLGDDGYGNTIDVAPGPGFAFDLETLEGARRGTLTTASCGVCGRRSIEDLRARCPRVSDGKPVARDVVSAATQALRSTQPSFVRTGGAHAAAAFEASGSLVAAAEDVGRHNAVDKVVGLLVRNGRMRDSAPAILVVSGRASFEIVQKAAMAGVALVASVSSASSLACDLAESLGITLVGFVRDARMVAYAHASRIV